MSGEMTLHLLTSRLRIVFHIRIDLLRVRKIVDL
jgi:hypothetical protein